MLILILASSLTKLLPCERNCGAKHVKHAEKNCTKGKIAAGFSAYMFPVNLLFC